MGGDTSRLIAPGGCLAYIRMTGEDKTAIVHLGRLEIVSELGTGDGPDDMAWVDGG